MWRGRRERGAGVRNALSQLGSWQSVAPAVKHGDLAACDLLTVLQTFPHSVRFDMFFVLSSSAESLSHWAKPAFVYSFSGNFRREKNFLLFQCFIFKSTLSMVYLCKATFGYKVLHRIQVGTAAFLKINWGSCEPVQKNLKIPNITGPLHLVVLFSIIFWAWIFLNFFSHISF